MLHFEGKIRGSLHNPLSFISSHNSSPESKQVAFSQTTLQREPTGTAKDNFYQIKCWKSSGPLTCTVHSWPRVGPPSCQEEHSTSHFLP